MSSNNSKLNNPEKKSPECLGHSFMSLCMCAFDKCYLLQFSSVQTLSHVQLFATPWATAHQASPSITNSQSSLRLMSIESMMPSSHLILGHPLLLLPPIPPSIRVFSNESTLRMRWPKYWSFSFNIIPSKEILSSCWTLSLLQTALFISSNVFCFGLFYLIFNN